MTGPAQRFAQASTAAIVIASALGILASSSAKADSVAPKSADECASIIDFALRGQCWDALYRAGLNKAQLDTKRDFGLHANPPPDAPIIVAKPAKKHEAEVGSLTLKIAAVGVTSFGRALLTSTDGAVWELTDGDELTKRPSPGDTIQISQGVMGGYICQMTRWQLVRCRRDK
jgi:hypothetical protein